MSYLHSYNRKGSSHRKSIKGEKKQKLVHFHFMVARDSFDNSNLLNFWKVLCFC